MVFLHSHGVGTSRFIIGVLPHCYDNTFALLTCFLSRNYFRAKTSETTRSRCFVAEGDCDETASFPDRFDFDPWKDIQVLLPMTRGILGTRNINASLQKALNPSAKHRSCVTELLFGTATR